jgi:apolipoprotein N-acyltransferase
MRRWQLAAGGAVLTAAMLAAVLPPFNAVFLAPAALTPLLYALTHESRWGPRFLAGWLAGFLYWLIVCHWIKDVLAAYGGLTGPLAAFTLVAFAMAKGLHMAVFAALAGPILRRPWAVPAVAALWTGIERTHGPLGFAWLTLGNAGVEMGLPVRLAPWVGVYGLSFVFAALGASLALVLLRRPRRQIAWLLALAGLWFLPPLQLREAPVQQAVVAQPNIAGDAVWDREEKDRMLRQLMYSTLAEAIDVEKRRPALLLWPEAPAPLYYYQDDVLRRGAAELTRLAGAPFIFGGVAFTPRREPLNSAFIVDQRGQLAGRYDKRFLVPFGEFIPSGFGWIEKISSEAGNYAPGLRAGVFAVADHRVGLFICYESAFPHLVREVAAGGAEVLINLTNDGYFGRSRAPREQHLALARMRAIENARWLLRPANDGMTAVIDPVGRVWDQLTEFSRQTGRLRFAWQREQTAYTKWGDWFAWVCLVAGVAGVVFAWMPVYQPPRAGGN